MSSLNAKLVLKSDGIARAELEPASAGLALLRGLTSKSSMTSSGCEVITLESASLGILKTRAPPSEECNWPPKKTGRPVPSLCVKDDTTTSLGAVLDHVGSIGSSREENRKLTWDLQFQA